MRKVADSLIRSYQLLISPLMGRHCRYHPSCSEYTRQAIRHHGIAAGGWLGLKRIFRCHPWAEGGFDPVPGVPEADGRHLE